MMARLQFPDSLVVETKDSMTQQPVPHVAVALKLFAAAKNDYYVINVSDPHGTATFSRAYVRESMNRDVSLYPMDYGSTLEECDQHAMVRIMSRTEVKAAVESLSRVPKPIAAERLLLRHLRESAAHPVQAVTKRVLIADDGAEMRIPMLLSAD